MKISRTELEKMIRQLRAVLAVLEAQLEPSEIPPEILAEMKSKMERRICLAWDHEIPEGERVSRGLCETDYATTMARIRRGTESENELMQKGQLAPRATKRPQKRRETLRSKKRKS